MDIDFVLIKELNEQIEKLLEERPEYREWWDENQEEIRKAGPENRFAVAQNLMLESFKKMREQMEELQKELNGRNFDETD